MTTHPGGADPAWPFGGLDDVADLAEGLLRGDRDGEVAALIDAERRGVTLARRLLAEDHEVQIGTAHGTITGTVVASVEGFLIVTGGMDAPVRALVSLTAVAGIRGLSPRPRLDGSATVGAPGQVAATANRWLSQAIGTCVAAHGRGWSVAGELTAVFADHVEITSAGICCAVPLHALEVLLVASG